MSWASTYFTHKLPIITVYKAVEVVYSHIVERKDNQRKYTVIIVLASITEVFLTIGLVSFVVNIIIMVISMIMIVIIMIIIFLSSSASSPTQPQFLLIVCIIN